MKSCWSFIAGLFMTAIRGCSLEVDHTISILYIDSTRGPCHFRENCCLEIRTMDGPDEASGPIRKHVPDTHDCVRVTAQSHDISSITNTDDASIWKASRF